MKTCKRQLERLHKKTGLTVHFQSYSDYLKQYMEALSAARSTYYSHLIHSGSSNPKALFSTINKLLKPSDNTSPSFTADKCNALTLFTAASTLSSSLPAFPRLITQPLSQFSPVSPNELSIITSSMKSSTSILDPIPSSLVKNCLPAITPLITSIINSSLCSGSVPKTLKLAAVTHILKKLGLNTDSMCNFRPISNLPFLSKILKRVVASQIKCHLSSNNLFEPFQSSFRSQHSTETALLKVTNDLLLSSDSGLLNILILLDLTAAFDTISHSILLSRLEHSLNITGTALSWLKSYFTDRQQFININNCSSSIALLSQGVNQGSVLGPLLFIIYFLPLGNIICQHGLHFHCYTDDIQLYISINSITTETCSTLTNCLNEIKTWMHTNFLSLNYAKSDIIIIGPKSLTNSIHNFSFTIDNSTLSPFPHIRNLGVIFDSQLSFDHHVTQLTRTAFFHLKNIARLRPLLSFSAAETLIHAFITSRLDYCNSILFGTPSKVLNKLQYIQNSAARLLTHLRTCEHITPVLQNLHWLPVPYRIQFKILLLTHKALNHQAPSYLTALLHPHTPVRVRRSSKANLLSPPLRTKHRTWGDRAFSIAAPSLWNSLPTHIQHCTDPPTFKSLIKTHLFKQAFNV
uniref:Reverse transcriptase domain-containing protein n=1 Tax=Labrus bergylta TaxID=56723 RepID=A0A3Q3MWV1_9LABR